MEALLGRGEIGRGLARGGLGLQGVVFGGDPGGVELLLALVPAADHLEPRPGAQVGGLGLTELDGVDPGQDLAGNDGVAELGGDLLDAAGEPRAHVRDAALVEAQAAGGGEARRERANLGGSRFDTRPRRGLDGKLHDVLVVLVVVSLRGTLVVYGLVAPAAFPRDGGGEQQRDHGPKPQGRSFRHLASPPLWGAVAAAPLRRWNRRGRRGSGASWAEKMSAAEGLPGATTAMLQPGQQRQERQAGHDSAR